MINIVDMLKEISISGDQIVRSAALLGAGIAMGVGAIGPGIGEGFAAGKACEGISKRPEESGLLTRTMLVGQAVSESTGIYSLVIALLLIFVVA
jgi:F-type H+-transporting ATPase subunit c